MANGYAQNIGAPASLLGSFDAAVKIRRNIEEVRTMMQAREDMRAAREAVAAANEQIAQVSGEAMQSSAEMKQLLRDMAAGKKVSPDQLRATTTLYQMDALELGNRKNQILTNLLGPLMGNPEAVRTLGGMISQNNEAISKFGAFLQGGMEDAAAMERVQLQTQAQREVAQIGAAGRIRAAEIAAGAKATDPMQATLDAQQFVQSAIDPEELKTLAEGAGISEAEIMRGATGFVAQQIMQGEVPNIDEYLGTLHQGIQQLQAQQQEEGFRAGAERRRAAVTGAAGVIGRGFAEKGRQVIGLAKKVGEAGQTYRPQSGPTAETFKSMSDYVEGWGRGTTGEGR